MSHKKTTTLIIELFKQTHGDTYDYSKVIYDNAQTKVCITCKIHGDFYQKPISHINGAGCPLCNPKRKKNKEEIIEKFNNIHNNSYLYDKFVYNGIFKKSIITCKIHGDFYQDPHSHLKGCGCPKCGAEKRDEHKYHSQDSILKQFKIIHGDTYDYSKFIYNGINEKSCITCKIHGDFYQDPHSHLKGCGCPKCKTSHLEKEVMLYLEKHHIQYIYLYRTQFLKKLSLDFFLPDYNIGIECQGILHYKPILVFGGKIDFEKQLQLDNLKKEICEEHGLLILYYTLYKNAKNILNTFLSLKKLLLYIKNKNICQKN